MKHLKFVLATPIVALTVAHAAPASADDPTTADCLAALDASLQSGNQHQLRAERSQLLVCAALNCPVDVRNECGRRMGEVREQIPTIVFDVKDASGNDLSVVKVKMDGEVLAQRVEGSPLSIDPGEHTFTFEAQGQPTLTKRYVILQGQKDRRERVSFADGAAQAGTAPVTPSTGSVFAAETESASDRRGPALGAQKIAAIAVAGLGVGAVGVGAVFGLVSIGKHKDAVAACPGACETPAGVSLWESARSAGTVSTVGFVVGGIAIAGGTVLWLTAKPAATGAGQTAFGLGPGRFEFERTW